MNSRSVHKYYPMKLLTGTLHIIKNKYIIAALLFIVWMCFFDPKDWPMIAGKKEKLRDLQKSELHLGQKITETRQELGLLKTNAKTIEQYAREKYLMKKDNEDLFLVNTP